MSTLIRLAGDLQSGHVFAVKEVERDGDGNAVYQSVFPAALSEYSALHSTATAAWLYISEMIMEGFPDQG